MKKRIFAVVFSLFMAMAYCVPVMADVVYEPEYRGTSADGAFMLLVGGLVVAVVIVTALLIRYFFKRKR